MSGGASGQRESHECEHIWIFWVYFEIGKIADMHSTAFHGLNANQMQKHFTSEYAN